MKVRAIGFLVLALVLGATLFWHPQRGISQPPARPPIPIVPGDPAATEALQNLPKANQQPKAPKGRPKTPPPPLPIVPGDPAATDNLQDPTQLSPPMRDALRTPGSSTENSQNNTMPSISIKGRVLGLSSTPAALLEVNGKVQLVRQGSRLALGGSQVMHVKEISNSQVRIEIEPGKLTIDLQ